MGLTIKDIAKKANVSCATVSRVINNYPHVKEETRKIVEEIIKQNEYQPSALARGMPSKKSYCLGFIIPRDFHLLMSNPFYNELITGILTELNKRNYYLLYMIANDDNYLVNCYKQKRVDGFISIKSTKGTENTYKLLKDANAPFISTTKYVGGGTYHFVDIDNYLASVTALEYLISMNHRKIALILTDPNNLANSRERFLAYKDTLSKHKIPYDESIVEFAKIPSMQNGYDIMIKLLRNDDKFTAVFVASDTMALGVLKAIKESGKNIPKDISVIGFDNLPQSEFTDPPLTTIDQSAYNKGNIAARLLIDKLELGKDAYSVLLDSKLIIRESVSMLKL